ncbi:aldo/keto reductase [Demequina sp.]|uniref:aldo/keto reductase n=1 Tax=Demequina sp. TaxID=2050685 RepID=UPI0025BF5EBE|nr:aldo/keto reductase [Demequina sp.]
MKTRAFGTTGIEVSEIGLGSWQLGRSAQWPDGPHEDDAVRLVHAALDAGVTFIDTAPGYAEGRSELNIGAAIRGGRRDHVVICTKFGHRPDGGSDWEPASIERSILRSAERMGTDHLDIVVLHSPPPEVLDGTRSEHYEVLERLKLKGLIRAYGASVDWGADVDTVLRTSTSQALEVRMSALFQETWPSLERARDQGVGTIIKVPLESGWLSGRYTADTTFAGVRARWSRDDIALRAGLVDEFRSLLPTGVSVPHGALRFLLAHNGVSTVIPGARTVDLLRDSIAAAAEPLPAATVESIRDFYARRLAGSPLDW